MREEQVWTNGKTQVLFRVNLGNLQANVGRWRHKFGWVSPDQLELLGWWRIK